MSLRVGINGFGRIGRLTLRAILERYPREIKVVALNDAGDPLVNAHLLKHDTVYGKFSKPVISKAGGLTGRILEIGGTLVTVHNNTSPADILWKHDHVDVVIESTGRFTDSTLAKAHYAGKVIITAPAKNPDITIVMGVNHDQYEPAKHRVISNASCTTNATAPVAKVLHECFGIEQAFMTTVHAYTNSQRTVDSAAQDVRDARAAAENIVPSATGAAQAVELVLPELRGKFAGISFRVPVATGSVIDLTARLKRNICIEEVNEALASAARTSLAHILECTDEKLVSSDIRSNPHSSIVSMCDTMAMRATAKVISWYDNEWGYACRVADLLKLISDKH